MAKSHRTQTIEKTSVHRLHVFNDCQHFPRALGDPTATCVLQISSYGRDRTRRRFEPEQTWPDLIMKFQCDVPPFIVLNRDQSMVEPFIFGAHRLERLCERIEAMRDGGQFRDLWRRQADVVVSALQVGQSAGQPRDRIEHPAEQHIKNADDGGVKRQCDRGKSREMLPSLRDFIPRLAGNEDGTELFSFCDDREFVPFGW